MTAIVGIDVAKDKCDVCLLVEGKAAQTGVFDNEVIQPFGRKEDSATWLKTRLKVTTMSTITTSVTEEQFETYIRPCLSTARRGYPCKIALYKVFNYILYRLHTGCQWHQLPTLPAAENAEKKKSVGRRSTIIGTSGVPTGV
jgi:hypothetical protein